MIALHTWASVANRLEALATGNSELSPIACATIAESIRELAELTEIRCDDRVPPVVGIEPFDIDPFADIDPREREVVEALLEVFSLAKARLYAERGQ